jgi:hypothetical protein
MEIGFGERGPDVTAIDNVDASWAVAPARLAEASGYYDSPAG